MKEKTLFESALPREKSGEFFRLPPILRNDSTGRLLHSPSARREGHRLRRANSDVEVRLLRDPVQRYLEDAMALVRTPNLAEETSRRVVPGLCRLALESVFTQNFRGRRLVAGQSSEAIDAELGQVGSRTVLASLAFFDCKDQAGEVLPRLNRVGRWAGDAYRGCQQGAHGKFTGDLEELVRSSESLVRELRRTV